jgi:hypothetical protein
VGRRTHDREQCQADADRGWDIPSVFFALRSCGLRSFENFLDSLIQSEGTDRVQGRMILKEGDALGIRVMYQTLSNYSND